MHRLLKFCDSFLKICNRFAILDNELNGSQFTFMNQIYWVFFHPIVFCQQMLPLIYTANFSWFSSSVLVKPLSKHPPPQSLQWPLFGRSLHYLQLLYDICYCLSSHASFLTSQVGSKYHSSPHNCLTFSRFVSYCCDDCLVGILCTSFFNTWPLGLLGACPTGTTTLPYC